LMVKNPNAKEQSRILFHDIGDYLTREQKLKRIAELASINGLTGEDLWQTITPDEHGDWLRQRDDSFGKFIAIGSKDKNTDPVIFSLFSRGIETARDAWCFNSSRSVLETNIKTIISTYEGERQRFNDAFPSLDRKEREKQLDSFVTSDPTRISWSRSLRQDFTKNVPLSFDGVQIVPSLYRPFQRQNLYFDRNINNYVNQMPRLFPDAQADNKVIMIKQRQHDDSQFALMSNTVPDLQSDGGAQCFSEYLYEEVRTGQDRTGQDRTGQDRTGQDRTGQDRTIILGQQQKYKRRILLFA
ncbi:damage-inducible protein, partial [Komagataeibacter sp. FNDCR1]|nr:damage-inducible protein [Komagataeibacter sp. FNDCR1]